MSFNITDVKEYIKDFFKGMPWGARVVVIVVIAILYQIKLEPLVMGFFGEYEQDAEVRRQLRIENARLSRRMREVEYQDSIRRIAEAIYIDLALTNGFKAHTILDQLLTRTGNERSSVFATSGTIDTLSYTPVYGTFLAEVYLPGQQAFLPDWDNTFIPTGLKAFLFKAIEANEVVTIPDVARDINLGEAQTYQYLKSRGIKSMMSCFIGKSPVTSRYYFLLTFYHSNFLEGSNISRDIFYTRNACLNIRRLFGLVEIKK